MKKLIVLFFLSFLSLFVGETGAQDDMKVYAWWFCDEVWVLTNFTGNYIGTSFEILDENTNEIIDRGSVVLVPYSMKIVEAKNGRMHLNAPDFDFYVNAGDSMECPKRRLRFYTL